MQRQAMPPATPVILLTRPAPASARFAARLAVAHPQVEVLISPLQEVRMLDWTRPQGNPSALIFTSQNAVQAALAAGLTGLAYCVGNQTAEAAERAGFRAISAGGNAADLIARISVDGPRHLLHLHGRSIKGDIAAVLRAAGFTVSEAVVYDTQALPLTAPAQAALAGPRPILLPIFSPRSAARLAEVLTQVIAPLTLVSLSAAVDHAASDIPARHRLIAKRPDADGMLEIVAWALNSGALS